MSQHDLSTREGLAGWIGDHGLEVQREGPWNGGDYRWIIS